MKIKVKDTIEREIEITFPSYYKIVEQYTKNKYYAFFSEKLGLFICEGFTYQTTPNSCDFKVAVQCSKSEVEPIFLANQKLFATTMEGITVDLDSNTTTEDLEQLNK